MEIGKFIVWYIFLFIFGVIGLPIATKLFANFKDKGYGFSKAIGLLVFGLPIWLLSSLKIFNFQSPLLIVFFFLAAIASFVALGKMKFKINKYMVLQEVMFFVIFLIWGLIRSANPRIEGTEKFMNIAFMNSINLSESFPPLDPWFSTGTINYYYFGHYLFTVVSKITLIPVSFAYNLALNSIIGMLFISLNSIFTTIFEKLSSKKALILSLFISFLICFGGNLHYVWSIFESSVERTEFSYFFPDATRIIPFTINEFPSYSVVLGDLHGHYLALPYFLIAIALSLVSFKINIFSKKKIIFNLLISIFIVSLYSINSWDYVTANILFFIVHFFQVFKEEKFLLNTKYFKKIKLKNKNQRIAAEIIIRLLYVVLIQITLNISGLVIMLPYILNFKPAVGGIGIVPFEIKSQIKPWLLFWGVQLIISLIFILLFFAKKVKRNIFDNWVLLVWGSGIILIFGVEFVFLKDLFYEVNYDYFRTNTVFKFYYHAWILMGLAAGYFSYKILTQTKLTNKLIIGLIQIILLLLFVFSGVYIGKAVDDFYDLDRVRNGTLDGNAYIFNESMGDYYAIYWFKENVKDQQVVVEAVGDAYTYAARISANTGQISIMGWPTHEWQWRKNIDLINERKEDIRLIYETFHLEQLNSIIAKHNVKFVIIGDLEREKYIGLHEELLTQVADVVFDREETRIYKIKD